MPIAGQKGRAGLPANVASLIERLWVPRSETDWPVLVTTGALPSTHVAVETYAIAPSLRRPRFLLPVGAPSAVAAAFTRYLTTPSAGARAAGWGLAAMHRARLAPRVLTDRLVVGLDRRVPASEHARWLLMRRLAEELDASGLVAVHPVRRAVPAAKPTLRLFDTAGTPRGYAKVGWSEPTRAMVRTETAALRELDGGIEGLQVPRVLAAGQWRAHEYLVAAPLPARLRSWREPPERMAPTMMGIVDTGYVSTGRLAESAYLANLRNRLDRSASSEPEAAAVLGKWLSRLERDPAPLRYGRWHGDWVAWNLARLGEDVYCWDWEYSDPGVPVGFDLLHWHFQHRLAEHDGNLDNATRALDDAAPALAALDVPVRSHRLTASLYLFEMLTRAVGLAADGNGWNPKIHPSLLRVASGRDRDA